VINRYTNSYEGYVLPKHWKPFPVKPSKQEHLKDPIWLIHVALPSQGDLAHSFTSIGNLKMYETVIQIIHIHSNTESAHWGRAQERINWIVWWHEDINCVLFDRKMPGRLKLGICSIVTLMCSSKAWARREEQKLHGLIC
jgi:hypothetical protein